MLCEPRRPTVRGILFWQGMHTQIPNTHLHLTIRRIAFPLHKTHMCNIKLSSSWFWNSNTINYESCMNDAATLNA